MNGPNAPLSPVSVGGSEWSGISKYRSMAEDGPYPNSRGNLASPPNSGGSNGPMNGFGPGPGPRSIGGPSPPTSIAGRSSTGMYAKSESGRSLRDEHNEAVLGRHYVALRDFLSGRDDSTERPPNKAQDKLLRLSPVQFLELSTDVFDELMRRQAASRRPPGPRGPPQYLLAEQTFHPKRNQARQKLSSLGSLRFRDLANDVYCELERRFPHFVSGDIPRPGSTASARGGLPSRSGTPANGFPPRGQSRMRRPSDASSMRGVMPPQDPYSIPPSPSLPPNGDYGRPMQKQFQSNTIVPNKSTMVEEDDDAVEDARVSEKSHESVVSSEADKKLIDDYQTQIRELREQLETMEGSLKKKDGELANVLDEERTRSTATNVEKKEWADMRLNLENKLAEAQDLNESLKQELGRMRDDHDDENRTFRDQLEGMEANLVAAQATSKGPADSELQQENDQLRSALEEQQHVTEDARREAREFLREMKLLSQQSGATWDKQGELESTVETLEQEVRDWRNRYARTKTQLRNLRASSMGLTIDQDASKYLREKGFTEENGLVKDVNVTKFQTSIDELLQQARSDGPEKVLDAMKRVVVNIRRITKDMDESGPPHESVAQSQTKLKSRVSSTANHLITASKNFASAAGLSPVSLLDAAASHLVAAVVELLRTVKIRATPAGELEDDDDGTITPVESTGFFSPRTTSIQQAPSVQDPSLPPPPPFQGLGPNRSSIESSAYSPVSSPRQSVGPYGRRRSIPRGGGTNSMANGMTNGMTNGMGYGGINKNLAPAPLGNHNNHDALRRDEDLKIYLEDQTAVLVQNIQNLVGSIRSDANIDQITSEIDGIIKVVGKVVSETETSGNGDMTARLGTCRERLEDASDRGQELASAAANEREWKMWTQTLPPIAFEIARETKELVQRVDQLVIGGDDFS